MEEVGRYVRFSLGCSKEVATVEMNVKSRRLGFNDFEKKDVMNGEAEGDEVACMFWSWAAVCLKKKFFQSFDHSL
jgi:hypothetical protein